MPLEKCTSNGRPGYKWGTSGKCYTYDANNQAARERAKQLAVRQGQAIEARRQRT